MFLTICLFNEGMFAITAAKTKMQKIPAIEKDVKKQENSFTLLVKLSNGTANAEKLVGSSKVKRVNVS